MRVNKGGFLDELFLHPDVCCCVISPVRGQESTLKEIEIYKSYELLKDDITGWLNSVHVLNELSIIQRFAQSIYLILD